VIGTARDISDRLRAEKDLEQERERAQKYLELLASSSLSWMGEEK
jgi:hypothetical protein